MIGARINVCKVPITDINAVECGSTSGCMKHGRALPRCQPGIGDDRR